MLEELFCAHRAELTAYCRGLCRSDAAAQDMVQEVFLRAWQNIGTLQDLGPSQRRAWLYRTARNLFVDAMRRTAREAAALPELEPEPETRIRICRSGSPPPVGIADPGGAGAIPQALPGRLHRSGTGKNVRFAACHRAHPAGQSPPILKPIIDGGINDAE